MANTGVLMYGVNDFVFYSLHVYNNPHAAINCIYKGKNISADQFDVLAKSFKIRSLRCLEGGDIDARAIKDKEEPKIEIDPLMLPPTEKQWTKTGELLSMVQSMNKEGGKEYAEMNTLHLNDSGMALKNELEEGFV